MNIAHDHGTGGDRAAFWLLLLALALALLHFVSYLDADLIRAGEARAAEIAREMVERGNFIIPTLNHEVSGETLTKPPLFHWLVAAVGSSFEWQNWAVRLPGMLAALATIWMVFLSGRLLFNFRVGVYAVMVLSTSILFMQNGSASRIDILFTLLIVVSLYSFWRALLSERDRGWIWGFYICSGLAVVAKGPVGFLVPFAVALYYLFNSGQRRRLKELAVGKGLLLFFLIAVPWYVAMAMIAPYELVDRFFFGQLSHWWAGSAKTADEGGKPFLYYVPHLLGGLFPWSLFIPGILYVGFQEARKDGDGRIGAVLFWFLGGLLLFSLGGKKASRYLLPLMPAFALLAGVYWDRLSGAVSDRHRKLLLVTTGLLVALCLVLLGGLLAIHVDSEAVLEMLLRGRNLGGSQQLTEGWGLLQESIIPATVVLLLVVAAALFAFRAASRRAVFGVAAGTAAVIWLLAWPFVLGIKPQLEVAKSPRLVAEEIRQMLPEEEELFGGGKAYKHAMRWYLGRDISLETLEDLHQRVRQEPGSWVLLMHKKPPPEELLTLRPDHRKWRVDYYYVTLFPGTSEPH